MNSDQQHAKVLFGNRNLKIMIYAFFSFCNKQYFNDCGVVSVLFHFERLGYENLSTEISCRAFVFLVCSLEWVFNVMFSLFAQKMFSDLEDFL